MWPLLSYLIFALALPSLLLKKKLRLSWRGRRGLYDTPGPSPDHKIFWLHGASAGDISGLGPTAEELRVMVPKCEIFCTTMTRSGFEQAKAMTCFDHIEPIPYDLPTFVSRAFDHIRPNVLVLEYAELWPNLLREAYQRNVKVVLHNARIHPERFKRYQSMFRFTGNLVANVSLALAKSRDDAKRLQELGVPPGPLHATGDTKWDALLKPSQHKAQLMELRRKIKPGDLCWVCGSIHDDEEDLVLDALCSVRSQHPKLRCVIAPRYPERAKAIEKKCRQLGLSVRRRSDPSEELVDVVILDSIGELSLCYGLADVAFVGGSFGDRGGQNLMEPAVWKVPVVFGPNVENFANAARILLQCGCSQVDSQQGLTDAVQAFCSNKELANFVGEKASTEANKLRGASTRNAALLASVLKS